VSTFLKIAYQPYKWFIVIPFVLLVTMVLGLICIVVGFVIGQDAADSLDLVPGTIEIVVHRPIYIAAYDVDRIDEITKNIRRTICCSL